MRGSGIEIRVTGCEIRLNSIVIPMRSEESDE